jgi:uncharacterized membrane protein HdeD (DUF308 family)
MGAMSTRRPTSGASTSTRAFASLIIAWSVIAVATSTTSKEAKGEKAMGGTTTE